MHARAITASPLGTHSKARWPNTPRALRQLALVTRTTHGELSHDPRISCARVCHFLGDFKACKCSNEYYMLRHRPCAQVLLFESRVVPCAAESVRRSNMRLTVLLALLSVLMADAESCIFEHARLHNETGSVVTCAELEGRSVALYFAGEWCPLCRRFTPALRAFHAQWNQSVQIVFISSDMSAADATEHYAHQLGGWLMLPWDDPVSKMLKRRHKIWSAREIGTFGYGRRSGVPAVVVISPDGAELAFLPGERWGAAALHEWDPQQADHAWPRAPHKSEL